jgi:hypothetical protein
MSDFNFVLSLARAFMPPARADSPTRRRIEATPPRDAPRASAAPRPAPVAHSQRRAAKSGH